jgi:hypothetical protein
MRTAALALVVSLLLVAGNASATVVYWTPAHQMAPPVVYGFLAWGDLDADGDTDVSEVATEYWNDGGCPGPPQWRVQTSVLPTIPGCTYRQGTLGDLDGDGDLDLVTGCWEPYMHMHWNVGTPEAPQWQYDPSAFPGGPYGAYYHSMPRLSDLDGDGDLDLVIHTSSHVYLCENAGTAQVPQWGLPCEVMPLPPLPPLAGIALGDLDGDGDQDLVGITSDFPIRCWENVGTPQEWQFIENAAMLTGVNASTYGWGLALPDVNCDGAPDLLLRDSTGAVLLYLNESVTPVAPSSWGTVKAMYR